MGTSEAVLNFYKLLNLQHNMATSAAVLNLPHRCQVARVF